MAEPLRSGLPERELLREIDDITETNSRELARLFLEALAAARNGADLVALERALTSEKIAAALRAIPWLSTDYDAVLTATKTGKLAALRSAVETLTPRLLEAVTARDLPAVLRELPGKEVLEILARGFIEEGALGTALRRGNGLGLRLVPPPPGGGGEPPRVVSTDRLRARALEWLDQHGAEQVVQISAESRKGLQALLRESWAERRRHPETRRALADLLDAKQVNGLIGIRSKQGEVLMARFRAWEESLDYSPAQLQVMLNREHHKMVRQRADLIGRTEASEAGNEGVLQVWEELNESGEYRIAGLRDKFSATLEHEGGRVEVITAARPPLHPRCYCAMRLRRRESADGTVFYVPEWVTRAYGVCKRCAAMDEQLRS